jgi:pimeloyl-ACP methyl ester carboxylesterase
MAETAFSEGEWESEDGLRLHYRDYAGGEGRPPLLCLHGLTRNARDFEPVAEAFAGEWRMIAVDLRGRGKSDDAKDPATYQLPNYLADIDALLEQAGIARFVAIGTSLGGSLTMLLAAQDASRIAGAVINDIGPELEPAGLARILEYVGQGGSFETWMHAARHLREQGGSQHPAFAIGEWLAFAKRVMVVGSNGRIVFDYDMRIAEPLHASGGGVPDLWPAFRALGGVPSLVIRGAESDLLSGATVDRMQAELPGLRAVTVAGVGHPPTLAEAEAQAAIAALLAEVS